MLLCVSWLTAKPIGCCSCGCCCCCCGCRGCGCCLCFPLAAAALAAAVALWCCCSLLLLWRLPLLAAVCFCAPHWFRCEPFRFLFVCSCILSCLFDFLFLRMCLVQSWTALNAQLPEVRAIQWVLKTRTSQHCTDRFFVLIVERENLRNGVAARAC